MLGHILRSPENSPAALSLSFAVDGSKDHKGRVGSHKTNLLKILRADLEQSPVDRTSEYLALKKKLTLGGLEDVENLRMLRTERCGAICLILEFEVDKYQSIGIFILYMLG